MTKYFGLAMMAVMLAGPLTGCATCDRGNHQCKNYEQCKKGDQKLCKKECKKECKKQCCKHKHKKATGDK